MTTWLIGGAVLWIFIGVILEHLMIEAAKSGDDPPIKKNTLYWLVAYCAVVLFWPIFLALFLVIFIYFPYWRAKK